MEHNAASGYRASTYTCECGKTYSNVFAHLEECHGKPAPRVVNLEEEAPEALESWRTSMRRGRR